MFRMICTTGKQKNRAKRYHKYSIYNLDEFVKYRKRPRSVIPAAGHEVKHSAHPVKSSTSGSRIKSGMTERDFLRDLQSSIFDLMPAMPG